MAVVSGSGQSPAVELLAEQQRAFLARIATANSAGNLDGLFAFHMAGDTMPASFSWAVLPRDDEWDDLLAHAGQYPALAASGFLLHHFPASCPPSLRTAFTTELARLRARDPFPDDRISFAFHPVAFLGLALGALTLSNSGVSDRVWLANLLTDPRRGTSSGHHVLLYAYIDWHLTCRVAVVDDRRSFQDALGLAALTYGLFRGALALPHGQDDLRAVHRDLLTSAATIDARELDACRAALLWRAVDTALARSVDELVLSTGHVSAVLRRFESALRRWRWDDNQKTKPIRWAITSEREVQDILWLVLRSVFDDLVDEDTLPKFGHSTYKADFGIPSLRLLVEAKYARSASDFKAVEKEIMEDSVAYLRDTGGRYESIVVFIYDHSSSVQEHDVTINALRQLEPIRDVIIVSRPSQLPG